ncbi:hypothetical protein DAEQUDRAFT_535346 [Daedalea quercina L-15889]|uniref:Uncharacterized protein n=1 Tax=Daedalea quercina L-15889 TaxID=1314783 RepID=A0A165M7Q4_9APHY|nr:hypothetical protein DAEQUDRAFT_535346 [Daedalea quercina L-15889]
MPSVVCCRLVRGRSHNFRLPRCEVMTASQLVAISHMRAHLHLYSVTLHRLYKHIHWRACSVPCLCHHTPLTFCLYCSKRFCITCRAKPHFNGSRLHLSLQIHVPLTHKEHTHDSTLVPGRAVCD